ncbi:hypothetical protein [Deinococcus navajonensis]|uniref:Uncharacterized protein n=1 Tax=Deinococcus navajonensis TaxID=309884 RepID=A0ABV8XKW1_9DEIO
MDDFRAIWAQPVAGYWLVLAWVVLAAGWLLLTILWSMQVYLAAQGARWPAMYVHIVKTIGAISALSYFVLSLLWRKPAMVVTVGESTRNIISGLVLFALFIETVWRIKESIRARAIREVVKPIPFLKEAP